MQKNNKIYVAGQNGMVGSAITRELVNQGYKNVLKVSRKLDLRVQSLVETFFIINKPEYVFMAASKVGGIYTNNTQPADFIYDNVMIQTNLIYCCQKYDVKKVIFLGSSCIYPKKCKIPITEDQLLSGYLEPTNKAYAMAKLAGIEMCESYNRQYKYNKFYAVIPCNLYGYNDKYDTMSSHVLPALISKIYKAKQNKDKELKLWGTGKVRREFLFVDDLANACIDIMSNNYDKKIINVGYGEDITIKKLATMIKKQLNYKGKILFDEAMPDGTKRKLINSSYIKSKGWNPNVSLDQGIQIVIDKEFDRYSK